MKRQKEKELLIEQLKKTPIVQVACERVGVARATLYRWKKESPEFTKTVENAIREGKSLVNDLAESQLLSAIRDRNLTAILFWLKNNHPDYTTRVELSGRITHLKEELSDEEKALVEEALRLAMPKQSESKQERNEH